MFRALMPQDQGNRNERLQGVLLCQTCGSAANAWETYCACCGNDLHPGEEKQRCNGCRNEIEHSVANFCPHCGDPVGSGRS